MFMVDSCGHESILVCVCVLWMFGQELFNWDERQLSVFVTMQDISSADVRNTEDNSLEGFTSGNLSLKMSLLVVEVLELEM